MRTERALVLLLEWFDVTITNEPLVGDLLEEFRSGRSRWWLSRQVFAAVGESVVREVASNKLLSLRAIAMGLVVAMPLTALLKRVSYFSWGDGLLQFWVLSCSAFAVAGGAIGHKFHRRRAAMVTAFTLYALIAKASLVGFNAHRLISPSHPFRDLAYAAATILAPLCTLIGAFLLPNAAKPMRKEHLEC